MKRSSPASVKECMTPASLALVVGLIAAQTIATLQVGWSNRVLVYRLNSLKDAGYTVVPGELIEPHLLSIKAALGGGLFFTLSIGAMITLATMGWLQLGFSFKRERKWWLIGGAGLWLSGLLVGNLGGFNIFASAYVILIPLAICLVVLGRQATAPKKRFNLFQLVLIGTPIALALYGFTQLDEHAFIKGRDRLLLSNPTGRTINDYYYRYSLFPAESIKSLSQKQVRTFYLSAEAGYISKQALRKIFIARDYLPVNDTRLADIILSPEKTRGLRIKIKAKAITVDPTKFINQPDQTLDRLLRSADNNRWFRKVILISLLVAFPLLIYIIFFSLMNGLLSIVIAPKASAIITTIVCAALGGVFIILLSADNYKAVTEADLNDLLDSEDIRRQLIGLKFVEANGGDPATLPSYDTLLDSKHVAVRYWLVRALGNSRTASSYHDLLAKLEDPSPNVVCMALHSLGKRGNQEPIPAILKRMIQSTHWYVQWYAFNALKRLRWRPKELN